MCFCPVQYHHKLPLYRAVIIVPFAGGGVVCPQVLCCGSDGVTYPTPCDLPEGVTCVSNNECPAAGKVSWNGFISLLKLEPCGDPSCGLTCPSGSKCVSTGAVCVTAPCCPANGCTGEENVPFLVKPYLLYFLNLPRSYGTERNPVEFWHDSC